MMSKLFLTESRTFKIIITVHIVKILSIEKKSQTTFLYFLNEYDQNNSQSHTTDQSTALRGRASKQ